jgi:hypothetical protein
MKKSLAIVVGILVVLIALRIGVGLTIHKSDSQQIKEALADAVAASKQGRPGGVLELLGNQISLNSQDASGQLGDLSQFIKKQHPDVTVENQEPVITGDNAQISSPVAMDMSFLGQHRTFHLKQVLLLFRKEPATNWYVFPTTKWKLEQVEIPNFSPAQLTE